MALLTLTLAGIADLRVTSFSAHESVSRPFVVRVTALSPNPSLALAAAVGQNATFTAVSGVAFAGFGARVWSGVIRGAAQSKAVTAAVGEANLSTYEFELVPRLWLLHERRGYRVYQHLSIPDIVDKLLAEWKIVPTWRVDRGQYPKLEYKVQYGESDHDFLSRLLEEAGLAYVFEGSEAHGSSLILADRLHAGAPRAGLPLPFVDKPSQAAEMEFVTAVTWAREVRPGARTLRDADFRTPARALFESAPAEKGVESRLERYDYHPGSFLVETGKGGDTPAADDRGIARYDSPYGKARATRELEALRTGARALDFWSNAFDLTPGSIFSIDGHPHHDLGIDKKLLVTTTNLSAELQGEWKLHAFAVPADKPYRLPPRARRPIAHGFQSATVVGPKGQEIHTDEFGRVRVQFPWDREGKNDERSSCWVRVHEGWGGLGYGMQVLPRIGQEVLVSFLGGDPEQPIILGRAYNAVEQVPYKLPQHKTRSTWKSNSSVGGNGFNEIMYEDLKGQELVWMQAEKDRIRLVKNDESATVVHDREVTVKNDLDEHTDGHHLQWIGKDEDHVVKQSRRERIEGDAHVTVNGTQNIQVDGSQSVTVLEDQAEKVDGRYALRVKKQAHFVAGEATVGEGGQDVTIKSAGGFLRIDSAGVTIVGTVVKINAGGAPGQGRGVKPEDPHDPPEMDGRSSEKKAAAQKKEVKQLPAADCEIQTIEVACEHDEKRKYKVKLPAAKDAKPPTNVLEVIAAGSGDPEKIKTTIVLAKPRCAAHKPHALTVKGPKATITKAEDVSTVDVIHSDDDIHAHAFEYIWPWNIRPVDYTFTGSACHGPTAPVTVRVYPKVEPSFSLEFALDTDSRVTEKMEKARKEDGVEKRGRPAQTAWKLAFKGKIKYGGRSIEMGAKFDDKIKKLASVNLLVKRAIDMFCEYFYKYTGVTILPVFPKLSISYDGKFKEVDETYRVGAEWNIKLKADPLIGLTVKFEILDLMINALKKTQFSAIAIGFEKFRKWAKEKGSKFEITLAFTGTIGGEIGAKKNAKAAKAGIAGAIEGKLKAEFSAKATLGSKGVISFELGAEVKADTGLSAKLSMDNDDKGVFLKGKLTLNACKFKYAAWASGKVFFEIKESYDGEHTFWDDIDLLKSPDVYVLKSA
ncbi:MAG: type VI secretion system tip protein TssI/VgrG [Polyangiaceae bacterium]